MIQCFRSTISYIFSNRNAMFLSIVKKSLHFQYEVNSEITGWISSRTIFPRQCGWLISWRARAIPMFFPWRIIKLVVFSSRDLWAFKETLRLFRWDYCSCSSSSFLNFSLSSVLSAYVTPDVMYGGVSSTDFTFCRRTVFVGSSWECIFK